MTNLQEFTFLSSDGKTTLHGMEWLPEGKELMGVLQIAHGVAEHIARYDGFARFLNEQGIAVVGHDHLATASPSLPAAPPSTSARATPGRPWWTTSIPCTCASRRSSPTCPCS